MKVYKVHLQGFCGPCVYDNVDGAVMEIKDLLQEGYPDDRILVSIGEMNESEFSSLPEFDGY